MKSEDSLPSLAALDRILRDTTERLAAECVQPTAQAPDWSEAHWCIAKSVAAMHGIAPLLAQKLCWHGPESWREFLIQQRQHTFLRHQRILDLARQIDAQARLAGIAIVALKGAALHELGIYEPGLRPMADIDLLVNEADAAAATNLLKMLGYRECYRTRRHRTFKPQGPSRLAYFGESTDADIKIELHTRITEFLPVREADITALLLPEPAAAGMHHYRSDVALMTHLLLHAAGNMRARSLRLIQLNDISALSGRLGASAWNEVLSLGTPARAWWSLPPLVLTEHYYPGAIPQEVLLRASTDCPRVLRYVSRRQRLTDVSLSHLRIDFCPGSEWCGSLSELLRYLRARTFPSPETRAEVRTCEATQPWAWNSSWTSSSRMRRVATWLLTRPARVPTMWSIRSAWEQSGE
jgi:hypothetical protein